MSGVVILQRRRSSPSDRSHWAASKASTETRQALNQAAFLSFLAAFAARILAI